MNDRGPYGSQAIDLVGRANSTVELPRRRRPGPPPRSGEIDLGDLLTTLRRNWMVVAGFAASLTAVMFLATMLSRPVFRARGSLYLGDLQSKAPPPSNIPGHFEFAGGQSGEMGTETEILRSRDLVKRAIVAAALDASLVPHGWSPPRYWRWRTSGRSIRLMEGASGAPRVRTAALADPSRGKTFLVEFVSADSYRLSSDGTALGSCVLGQSCVTEQVSATLEANPVGPPAAGDQFDLTVTPLDEVADSVQARMAISVPKSIGGAADSVRIATIDFVDSSPTMSARLIDGLMRAYLDRRQSWRTEEASATESFVLAQVRTVKNDLDDAEKRLAEYKKTHDVVVLGDDAKTLIEQTSQFEQQKLAAEMQMNAFNQISRVLKNGKAPLEEYLVGETNDPVLAELSTKLAQAQQELRHTQERFTDESSDTREQKAQVNSQLQMVQNYVSGRRTRAEQQLASLNHLIGQFGQKLKTVPSAELELVQLTRSADVLGKMYTFLLERQQQATVIKASTMSSNRVLDAAEVPRREDAPLLSSRLAIGALLGAMLGLLFVIARRLFGRTFQTDRELRSELGQIPLFGMVPRRTAPTVSPPNELAPLLFDVFADDAQFELADAFRHIRTNLYYGRKTNPGQKVILITSPSEEDGKTFCTLALAAALATDGKRVLVVEGDMHRPVHHDLFRQASDPGLSKLLMRDDLLRSVELAHGSFDAITAGSRVAHPAEILSSPQFEELIAYARDTYDFVLIDSPPFPLVADAIIMSAHADRILTVIRLRSTRRAAAEEHFRRLAEAAVPFGVIVNGVDMASEFGSYGYGKRYAPPARNGVVRPIPLKT